MITLHWLLALRTSCWELLAFDQRHLLANSQVKVDVLVECITETMAEADGAETGIVRGIGAALEQASIRPAYWEGIS